MSKLFKIIFALLCASLSLASCRSSDPHKRGIEAGKAACECFQLEGYEAVESCLHEIEKENHDFINDTAYINAMEVQMLQCIADGVVDIVKPIKEPDTTQIITTDDSPQQ